MKPMIIVAVLALACSAAVQAQPQVNTIGGLADIFTPTFTPTFTPVTTARVSSTPLPPLAANTASISASGLTADAAGGSGGSGDVNSWAQSGGPGYIPFREWVQYQYPLTCRMDSTLVAIKKKQDCVSRIRFLALMFRGRPQPPSGPLNPQQLMSTAMKQYPNHLGLADALAVAEMLCMKEGDNGQVCIFHAGNKLLQDVNQFQREVNAQSPIADLQQPLQTLLDSKPPAPDVAIGYLPILGWRTNGNEIPCKLLSTTESVDTKTACVARLSFIGIMWKSYVVNGGGFQRSGLQNGFATLKYDDPFKTNVMDVITQVESACKAQVSMKKGGDADMMACLQENSAKFVDDLYIFKKMIGVLFQPLEEIGKRYRM